MIAYREQIIAYQLADILRGGLWEPSLRYFQELLHQIRLRRDSQRPERPHAQTELPGSQVSCAPAEQLQGKGCPRGLWPVMQLGTCPEHSAQPHHIETGFAALSERQYLVQQSLKLLGVDMETMLGPAPRQSKVHCILLLPDSQQLLDICWTLQHSEEPYGAYAAHRNDMSLNKHTLRWCLLSNACHHDPPITIGALICVYAPARVTSLTTATIDCVLAFLT
jgi:hypothetical protein